MHTSTTLRRMLLQLRAVSRLSTQRGVPLRRLAAMAVLVLALVSGPQVAQAKPRAPKPPSKAFKRAHAPKAVKKQPLAHVASSRNCSGGVCTSCPTWGGACWPMLDPFTASIVNTVPGGTPAKMSLIGEEPEIYERNGQTSQWIALRWGLQFKSTGGVLWDDWYYALVTTDSTPSTDFAGFGTYPNNYSAWNVNDSRIRKGWLGFNTNQFYTQSGLPAGNAYRLRLGVVWYNPSSPGGVQANNSYVVPFNGYGTNWNQWMYWSGADRAGNAVFRIGS